jgi:sec-independent protein translocase protein TatB
MKDADLGDLKSQIDDIRNFDIKSEIENAVDPDGALRETFASNPLEPGAAAMAASATAAPLLWQRPKPLPPAFIPPEIAEPPPPPAFIPPDAVRH